MPNLVSLTCSTLLIGGLFNFLINKNCHKSRTSNDIDGKLGQHLNLTRGIQWPKKLDDVMILVNFNVIVNFPFYGQFAANRKSYSARINHNFFLLMATFYRTKAGNRSSLQPSYCCFEKCWHFGKDTDVSLICGILSLWIYFLKLHIYVYTYLPNFKCLV